MKKLLLSCLLIALFAGCKKDSSDPCYVGTWEGDLTTITSDVYQTDFFATAPIMNLYSDGTGSISFKVSSTTKNYSYLAGYKIGLGFRYAAKTDSTMVITVNASSYTIGNNDQVIQSDQVTSDLAGKFMVQYKDCPFKCAGDALSFTGAVYYLKPATITRWVRK